MKLNMIATVGTLLAEEDGGGGLFNFDIGKIIDQAVQGGLDKLEQIISDKLRTYFMALQTVLSKTALDLFWNEEYIHSAVSISSTVSLMLVAATLVIVICDIAEEISSGSTVNWGKIVFNFIKGFCFALIAPESGRIMMIVAGEFVTSFNLSFTVNESGKSLILLYGVYNAGIMLFMINIIMRLGMMFVHIMTVPFYVPSAVRGDPSGISGWLRQAIAISITYVFQYVLFFLGASFISGELYQVIIGVALWITAAKVPQLLSKYGMSSGTRSSLSGAANAARGAISLIARI